MQEPYAITPKGRAVALTFRLRELFDSLPPAERERVLVELESLLHACGKSRVPLTGRLAV